MSIIVDARRACAPPASPAARARFHTLQQPRLRHQGRRRGHPRQGRAGRRRASPSSTPSTRRWPRRRPTRRWSSCRRRSRPTRSSRPRTRASRRSSHHRGHPRPRRAAGLHALHATAASRLIGPNCPGVLSPGKANVGIIPAAFFREGNVGVVSRSGTLTYQVGYELAQRGFGNSSIVGHRRRPRARVELRRRDRTVRGRPRDGADRDGRRDRRRRRGGRRRVHRRARHQARPRLHRRLHGPARQDDGARRRDHLRLARHRGGEGRGARGRRRPRRPRRRPSSPSSRSRCSPECE